MVRVAPKVATSVNIASRARQPTARWLHIEILPYRDPRIWGSSYLTLRYSDARTLILRCLSLSSDPQILTLASSSSDPNPQILILRFLSLRSSDPQTFTTSDPQVLILRFLSLGSSDPQILASSDPQILILSPSDPQIPRSPDPHIRDMPCGAVLRACFPATVGGHHSSYRYTT